MFVIKGDPIIKLALSIHSNPGIYALLLGSGLSRSAGIPTGWDIVLDLIQKLAALKNEKPEPDPETWYKDKFGEPSEYSKLLDMLTATPAERMAILKAYFEPTDEEKEQGLKVPTPAHRAIAKLVKLGYFRMILTTNFDRLLEKALQDEGIEPDVISSDDDLKGALPYIHSKCYVVKLHGNYLDTRIKNTRSELSEYSSELNAFLDRVFDDFGLIICGWSGTWDIALRNAILRSPNRRFPTYWLARGKLTEEAKEIIHHRRAEVIYIESADQFFTNLLEKIEALREIERPHPLSTEVAVSLVKKYLSNPLHRIRLHDLIHKETEKIYQKIISDRFPLTNVEVTKESFQKRIREYEAITEILLKMFSTISYFGQKEHSYLLTKVLNRLSSLPRERNTGIVPLVNLQYYPSLLLLYAGGISALASNKYFSLRAVLLDSQYRDSFWGEKRPLISKVYTWSVFSDGWYEMVPLENAERKYTPVSNYLNEILYRYLADYLPDRQEFDEVFDLFEYILALTYMDLVKETRYPVGSFAWRYKDYEEDKRKSPLDEFVGQVIQQGSEVEILKAGFFKDSVERFKEIVEKHKSWLKEVTKGWI